MELSPESQLKEILGFAAANNIVVKAEYIFMEKEGRSGKRAGNRPEFQNMIAAAKMIPRPFDVILVWKFSRFARNQDESTFYKGMLRKKLGIDILSVSEPVLEGMYGRLIELIIEWQDEFYSYNLSAEVRRGMKQKAQGGGYQASFPYGYKKSNSGEPPIVVWEQAEAVKLIFSLYAEKNQSASSIARTLNKHGFTTGRGNPFERRAVAYILQNPFYTGVLCWNRRPGNKNSPDSSDESDVITVDGKHEAIISKELFEKASRRMLREKRCSSVKNPAACRHYLSGLIKCPVCDSGLSYNSSQSPCFQCWRYAKGLHAGSASVAEKKVMAALKKSLLDMGLCHILTFLENPKMTAADKNTLICSVLQRITFDRNTKEFYFYYYV